MDWDKAKEYLVPSMPTFHSLEDIKRMLSDFHANSPQRQQLAEQAMDRIQRDVDALAALGHNFTLVLNAGKPVEQFPTMLYKDDEEGLAHSQDELDAMLKDGWVVHPSLEKPAKPAPAKPTSASAKPS